MIMKRYSQFVCRHPFFQAGLVFTIVVVTGAVTFMLFIPDFTDPTKGFQTHETEISGNYYALLGLYSSLGRDIITSPPQISPYIDNLRATLHPQSTEDDSPHITNTINVKGTLKIVLSSRLENINIYSHHAIRDICALEKEIRDHTQGKEVSLISTGSFIANLARTDCDAITKDDVAKTMDILMKCSHHYHRGQLAMCADNMTLCTDVPKDCYQDGLVYNLLHFLTDAAFLSGNTQVLGNAMVIVDIPSEYQGELLKYIDDKKESLGGQHIKVVAVDTEERYPLFQKYLLEDAFCFAMAMAIILVLVYLYIRSLFLTICTMFYMVGSFSLAYFVYFVVYQQRFFSFVNLLAGIVVIALGADNIFIFNDIWKKSMLEKPNAKITAWMEHTMKHVFLTVFATSLTTAGAFFTNTVSKIEAIRYFGVFCGTTMVCSYILFVFWLPPVFIINHFISEKMPNVCKCPQRIKVFASKIRDRIARTIFSRFLPMAVWKLRYVFVGIFSLIGIGGLIVVFVYPKLSVSNIYRMQYFKDGHIAEAYWSDYRHRFRFLQQASDAQDTMDIAFVWGIKSAYTGSRLDTSSVIYDDTFDMSSQQSQVWMVEFCEQLRSAEFVSDKGKYMPCTLDHIKYIQDKTCLKNIINSGDCCQDNGSYEEEDKFDTCFFNISSNANVKFRNDSLGIAYFEKIDLNMKAYQINMPTSTVWTADYDTMATLYNQVQNFQESLRSVAPPGVDSGWSIGNFLYYDLQRTLVNSTYISIGISLAGAFLVIIVTTWDLALTLFALISILATITGTFGLFTLLGWKLEILESSIFSLSVGLSVDFTLHYGVAYRITQVACVRCRVKSVLSTVGTAIAMGAVTTTLAGACLLPVRVISYFKFGSFLTVVMTTSWIMSTFLFLGLCAVCHPITGYRCCQPSNHKEDKISSVKKIPKIIVVGDVSMKSVPLPDLRCSSRETSNNSSISSASSFPEFFHKIYSGERHSASSSIGKYSGGSSQNVSTQGTDLTSLGES